MRELAKTSQEPGTMEFVDIKAPEPASGKVLIKVDYTGSCGNDTEIYRFKLASKRMEMPTIIDHEYTGHVVERGEETSRFPIGEHVVERPVRGYGECLQYQIGEESICQDAVLTGADLDEAYAGYIAVPESAPQSVPLNVEPEHATLVELTAVCTRVVIQNSRVKAGDRMLTAGPGPIGLLCTQVVTSQGAEIVVAGVGRDANYRLPLTEGSGYPAVNVEEDDLDITQCELTDGVDFDTVFDTTDRPSGLPMAVERTHKGGQIVLVGQTSKTTIEFTSLVRAEIDLQCIYDVTFEDFERAFRLTGSSNVDHVTFLNDRHRSIGSEDAFEVLLASETCGPVFDVSVPRK